MLNVVETCEFSVVAEIMNILYGGYAQVYFVLFKDIFFINSFSTFYNLECELSFIMSCMEERSYI